MERSISCPNCGSRIIFGDSGYIGAAKCTCCNKWYSIYGDELTTDELTPEEERPAEVVYIWL